MSDPNNQNPLLGALGLKSLGSVRNPSPQAIDAMTNFMLWRGDRPEYREYVHRVIRGEVTLQEFHDYVNSRSLEWFKEYKRELRELEDSQALSA